MVPLAIGVSGLFFLSIECTFAYMLFFYRSGGGTKKADLQLMFTGPVYDLNTCVARPAT